MKKTEDADLTENYADQPLILLRESVTALNGQDLTWIIGGGDREHQSQSSNAFG